VNHEWRMRDRLRAYHDGSLDGRAVESLEVHLRDCSECASELRRMGEVDALLTRTRSAVPAVPAEDASRIFAIAVARSGIQRRNGAFGWRIAGVAALTLCAAPWLLTRSGVGVTSITGPRQMQAETRSSVPLVWSQVPQASNAIEPLSTAARAEEAPARRPKRARTRRNRVLAAHRPSHSLADRPAEPARMSTLLVTVTQAEVAPLVVLVTEASSEQAGFARAEATLVSPTGEQVFTQATVSTCASDEPVEPEIKNDEDQAPPDEPEEECDGQ
jgi:hypothetical protein